MDITKQGLITLLKSAVTREKLPLPTGFDMEAAYPQIKRHHMITLAYDGAVRCGVSRSDPVMQKLFQKYCKALLTSEGQMAALQKLFAAFDAAGVDYMPLKGSNMKALYPKPELRTMGDADILIRMEQRETVFGIMRDQGYAYDDETDHEIKWRNDALFVELHKRLIPSYNKDFHAYFADGWQLARKQGGTRYAMTAEDDFMFLFTHFTKHYRDGGIGCRHVLDLWVYRRAHPELDEEYLRRELEKLQLLEFYGNISRLIAAWFEDGEMDEKLEFITDFIFASGSWGEVQSRVLSQTVRDAKHSVLGFSGKLVRIWTMLFPPVEILKGKYTVLQKAPWMLPLVWIYRPFYKLLVEPASLKRERKNLEAINQETVDQRQRMLNYVGLDYRF